MARWGLLLASLSGATQSSIKQTCKLDVWTPALQLRLHWAGQASSWPAWKIFRRVCGQVVSGIVTFCKAELAKRFNSSRPAWNLGRAEHFLLRDDGGLNIAWDRSACVAEDQERQHRWRHQEELQWVMSPLEPVTTSRGQLVWIRATAAVLRGVIHWCVEDHAGKSSSGWGAVFCWQHLPAHGELELEEACDQCHPDPHAREQEAIRSVGSKGTLNYTLFCKKAFFKPQLFQWKESLDMLQVNNASGICTM